MRYQVVSVKDEAGQESVYVYAADRSEALQAVPALFATAPVLLGEIDGK